MSQMKRHSVLGQIASDNALNAGHDCVAAPQAAPAAPGSGGRRDNFEAARLPGRHWIARRRHAPALLAGLTLTGLFACVPAPSRPVVVVYGDSLTVQSEAAAQYLYQHANETIVFRAYGGTAMCDWVNQARQDRATLHPQRVVLAFTGNSASCVASDYQARGAAGGVANYATALRQMREAYPTESITVVLSPAMRNPATGWFRFNGNPALNAMYRHGGAQLHMAINADADNLLTPGHIFTMNRPRFLNGPTVTVRLNDGVHLTPDGAIWYGLALLENIP